jgi:Fic family protein
MADYLVENLIERFQIEQRNNDRGGVYALTQRMLAYNSNKIEGSTLTEKQTASLFDTGTLSSGDALIRAKDVEEMTGHFLMFNEMLKTYSQPLSHKLIKRYHYKLKSGVFEDIANGYPIGEYKSRRNIVSDIVTAPPEAVEAQMTDLLERYNAAPQHDLGDLARFHAEYETIHPFQDGNGRTGRIILFKECLKNGIIPFIVSDNKKADYYHALNAAQTKKEYGALEALFLAEQAEYRTLVEEFVLPIRPEHGDTNRRYSG